MCQGSARYRVAVRVSHSKGTRLALRLAHIAVVPGRLKASDIRTRFAFTLGSAYTYSTARPHATSLPTRRAHPIASVSTATTRRGPWLAWNPPGDLRSPSAPSEGMEHATLLRCIGR